ncbi:MAG: monovalent cation/H+ antiporter complex subunit F [Lachnospiraceae bacterium]|nr:monovalent cation/H+ antiporter complex subunit F [Lachnospiraceae bacterium]
MGEGVPGLAGAYEILFTAALIFLAVVLVLCLIRAIIGPRVANRVVAVNMMGTIVMVIIAILTLMLQEGYLADICLIYAMISFLAVIVLTKVYMGVYLEKKEHESSKKRLMDRVCPANQGMRERRENMAVFEWLRFVIGAILLLCGLGIFAIEMIGVYRFKYVLNRMHAAAMGDTLGIGFSLIGLIVMNGANLTSLKLFLVVAFLWFSSPTSSHLIARLEVTTDEEREKHYREVSLKNLETEQRGKSESGQKEEV